MKNLLKMALVLMVCGTTQALAQVKSPNGALEMKVEQTGGQVFLRLLGQRSQALSQGMGQDALTTVRLGLTTSDDNWADGVTLLGVSKAKRHSETYTNIHGKARKVACRWNEAVATLQDGNGKPLKVELRVYDDGVAFRYVLDEAAERRFVDEQTAWTMPRGARRWLQQFVTSYEG
ncbi:MAG: glycoside hydrolase family 97 N-terminal domain-containing protein, partial [Bacteroidaceae bacterium]|nr:glycoside hydrolase family 97 N-terminal domain-containing protein [Bacteroidaceae bacterium]